MRVLSLFSGIGGLDLGLRIATQRAVTSAYCDIGAFPREVLSARMADGRLDTAPVYTDVQRDWRDLAGQIDGICGGFPCQDISGAGGRVGITGERSGLFFDIIRTAGEVGARWLWLENVSAITVRGLDAVLGSLAGCGFDAAWGHLSAAAVGASQRRDRWFCFAWRRVADRDRIGSGNTETGGRERARGVASGAGAGAGVAGLVEFTTSARREGTAERRIQQRQPAEGCGDVAVRHGAGEPGGAGRVSLVPLFPPRPRDFVGWRSVLETHPDFAPALPAVRRVVDGVPYRFHRATANRRKRLAALGNAVVPAQAAAAFRELIRRSGVTA